MKKLSNRFFSLFLSLIMILSFIPNTFAYTSISNIGGGAAVQIPQGKGTGYSKAWEGYTLNSMWGYKVSVWFAPLDKNQPTGDNVDKKYKWGTGQCH